MLAPKLNARNLPGVIDWIDRTIALAEQPNRAIREAGSGDLDELIRNDSGTVELGNSGMFTVALGGFKYVKCIHLGANVNLNLVTDAGMYDLSSALTGTAPYNSGDWWYLEVLRRSDSDQWVKQVLSLVTGVPGSGKVAVWQRFMKSGVWSIWLPISGLASPSDFGARGSRYAIGATWNDAVPIQRWMNCDIPKILDAWYAIDGVDVSRDLDSGDQTGFQVFGHGPQTGIVLLNEATISIFNADVDTPSGANSDQITLKDFHVLQTVYSSAVPLTIDFKAGDTGSSMAGVHMENVHFNTADDENGVTFAIVHLHNVRNAYFGNVSGFGRYFGYAGEFIKQTCDADSAPVEIVFHHCRGNHVAAGFSSAAPAGAGAMDSHQGIYYQHCTAIAVNVGFLADGGASGFGEWLNITNCHALFRQHGVLTNNFGNVRVNSGYWLAHGGLSVAVGIQLAGSSIESACWISENRIRMEGTTASVRAGIVTPNTLRGKVNFNDTTSATDAYGGIAGTFTQLGNT